MKTVRLDDAGLFMITGDTIQGQVVIRSTAGFTVLRDDGRFQFVQWRDLIHFVSTKREPTIRDFYEGIM